MAGRGGRWAPLLAGTLLITSVVACGGDDAQAEAQRIVLGAAQATFATGTAQVLVTLDDEGSGQADFENLLSKVSVDLDGEATTVIVDGEDVFVGRDGVFTQDLDGLPDVATIVLFLQPLQALQILNGADGDIDIVGDDDDIDGVAVTHYQVTVDLQAAIDALDGADRAALQAAIDRLGSSSLVVDVWIDDDGVVRRMSSDVDGTTIRLDFADFGSPVRIRVPRPRAVVESAEDLALAIADVTGTGWVGTSRITSSTAPSWYAVGPTGEEYTLDMRCRPDGSCRNRESGNTWDAAGPGTWTISSDFTGDCSDTVTGEVTTPGGYHETAEYTLTVTASEDGVATEITQTGTIVGEVTPAGRADGCTIDGGTGGPLTATATVEGTVTRS